jgi:hypothetical protein
MGKSISQIQVKGFMINKIVEYKNEDSKIEIVPLFKN